MNKVINILKENNLYTDDYIHNHNKIFVNNKNVFINKYKFNNTSKNPIPNDMKRNKDGYLLLNDIPYITSNIKPDGHNNSYWFIYSNGSRILIKDTSIKEMQNELLFMYLARYLNIPCANYDIGVLSNKPVLVSESFLSPKEELYNYYIKYEKYYRDKKSVDIDDLIYLSEKINQDKFIKKMLIIDQLSENKDRFFSNLKVIKNKNKFKICPLFDNGILEYNKDEKKEIFLPSINNSTNIKHIYEYLLQDEKFKKWCIKYIVDKEIPDFKNIIYKDKNIIINDELNENFMYNVNNNRNALKEFK